MEIDIAHKSSEKLWFIEKIKSQINSCQRFILELKSKPVGWNRGEVKIFSPNVTPQIAPNGTLKIHRRSSNINVIKFHSRREPQKECFHAWVLIFAYRVIKTNILRFAN